MCFSQMKLITGSVCSVVLVRTLFPYAGVGTVDQSGLLPLVNNFGMKEKLSPLRPAKSNERDVTLLIISFSKLNSLENV